MLMVTEQSLSVEDKVLLAQVASERAAIVAKYDKVGCVVLVTQCFSSLPIKTALCQNGLKRKMASAKLKWPLICFL